MSSLHDLDFEVVEEPKPTVKPPPPVPPTLSLDLRLRWLEALLLGARPDVAERKHAETKAGQTVARSVEDLQRKLDMIVQGNDGLRKFMDHCNYSIKVLGARVVPMLTYYPAR